jgi:hypothetical protein
MHRAALLAGWQELGSSDPWDLRVLLGADDRTWHICVSCNWPPALTSRLEESARRFVYGVKATLDAAVIETAEVVCAAIGPPPLEAHQMPLTQSREQLYALVDEGHLMGLRPDQVRLLEAFQPWAFGAVVTREMDRLMGHLASLLDRSSEEIRLLTVWAASAAPQAFAGDTELRDIVLAPDGPMSPSHDVATFVVPDHLTGRRVTANPNVGFDLIFNAEPFPRDHTDNLDARTSKLLDVAEMLVDALEASVNRPAVWNAGSVGDALPPSPESIWVPVEFDDQAEHGRVASEIASSHYRLASYRDDRGDLVLLRLRSDVAADHVLEPSVPGGLPDPHVVGRRIPQASVIATDVAFGTATENAALEAAQEWGLPDFVFPPITRTKGSGIRELGDGTIVSGPNGLALQVKGREAASENADTERRWLAKRAKAASRQGAGTIRTFLSQPTLELANMRGRPISMDGTQVRWVVVAILDHPHPPTMTLPPHDGKVPTIVVLRRDWDFLWDQLRSASAVVDYFHRVADNPGNDPGLGEESLRYLELAHADLAAAPDITTWMVTAGLRPRSGPTLPLEPASSQDSLGHAVFRQMLDDFADTTFDGDEAVRLQILARLDRYSVGDRASLGRRLIEWFDECLLTPPVETRWHHRTMLLDHGKLQLAFSVCSAMSGYHAAMHRNWLMLRRHQLLEHMATAADEPPSVDSVWTVGLMLTPRPDGTRLWDTTVGATNAEPDFDPATLAILTETFGRLGTEGNLG